MLCQVVGAGILLDQVLWLMERLDTKTCDTLARHVGVEGSSQVSVEAGCYFWPAGSSPCLACLLHRSPFASLTRPGLLQGRTFI